MKSTAKSKFSIFKLRNEERIADEMIVDLQRKGYFETQVITTGKRLFIHKGERRPPKWVAFLMQICESDELQTLMKRTPSFVLLCSMDQAYYAVTGGAGHCHIKKYVDENFGLDTICRVLEPDNIKSLRQTALAGKVQQLERIFKESYNYNFDTSNWGKLTKEIIGKINKNLFNKLFGFQGGKSANIKLAAKSSFWISRSVSPEELDAVIKRLHEIQRKQPKFHLYQGFRQVKDDNLMTRLESRLVESLNEQYHRYSDNQLTFFETDIHLFYADAKEFLLCDAYRIDFPNTKKVASLETLDLPALFQCFSENGVTDIRKNYLTQMRIIGLDSDGEERDVQGGLRKFIFAEVSHSDENYYFVDGRWYQLTHEFLQEIDSRVKKILENTQVSFSLPPWRGGKVSTTEPDYITEICHNPKLVQMHSHHIGIKNGRDKTELCDVVAIKNGDVFLVFIKRGMGSSLRELFSQARVSLELFERDRDFSKKAISKVRERNRGAKIISDFSRYTVVLAINDRSLNRNHKPLESKLMTLAKLDLIHCVEFLKNELGVEQVIVYEIKYEVSRQRKQAEICLN